MAVTQFVDFLRTVRNRYSEVVSDGILEDYVIFKELQRANGAPRAYKGIIGGEGGIINSVGGNQFEWRLLSKFMESGVFGPSTRLSLTTPNVLKNPLLPMGGYFVGYFVSTFETMSMNTKEQYIPLLKLYEQMAERTWYDKFETQILKDDSAAGGWSGLPVFMATTGAYATNLTLSETNSKPAKFDYSGSGQSFDFSAMDRISQITNEATHGDSQGGPDAPSVGFLGRTDWQKVKSLIEDTRHVVDVDTDMVKIGFRNFTYNGIRFYWSDHMQTQAINKVYVLNMNYLGLAHATTKLMMADTAAVLDGIPGVLNLSLHKGQIFCSNTRKQGFLDNTNLS